MRILHLVFAVLVIAVTPANAQVTGNRIDQVRAQAATICNVLPAYFSIEAVADGTIRVQVSPNVSPESVQCITNTASGLGLPVRG